MIQLLQKDYDFPELREVIEKDLLLEEQTIEQLQELLTVHFPNYIDDLFNEISLNPLAIEDRTVNYDAIRGIDICIANYFEQKSRKLILLIRTGELKIEKQYYDRLDYYLSNSSNFPKIIPIEELDASFLRMQKNPNSPFVLLEHKDKLKDAVQSNGYNSINHIFNNLSNSNISSFEQSSLIISNLTVNQLGLLTCLLAEANHIKVGFKNINKAKLDKVFANHFSRDDKPIRKSTLTAKGYFGVETDQNDIDALETFLTHLQKTLKKLDNSR